MQSLPSPSVMTVPSTSQDKPRHESHLRHGSRGPGSSFPLETGPHVGWSRGQDDAGRKLPHRRGRFCSRVLGYCFSSLVFKESALGRCTQLSGVRACLLKGGVQSSLPKPDFHVLPAPPRPQAASMSEAGLMEGGCPGPCPVPRLRIWGSATSAGAPQPCGPGVEGWDGRSRGRRARSGLSHLPPPSCGPGKNMRTAAPRGSPRPFPDRGASCPEAGVASGRCRVGEGPSSRAGRGSRGGRTRPG